MFGPAGERHLTGRAAGRLRSPTVAREEHRKRRPRAGAAGGAPALQ